MSAGLGSALASSTAAVEVCASGSVTHQSYSLSKPTAERTPQVPRSLSQPHTLKKPDKTLMSLYLTKRNSRIAPAVLFGL